VSILIFSSQTTEEECRVYGEFQDSVLFEKALAENPEMKTWSDKQLWDGLTGATLQAKTFDGEAPGECTVWLDEKILAYADGFGQFWFKIKPGVYTFAAKCPGYAPVSLKVELFAGERKYINFILPREASQ